jgi:hypothetical protein
VHPRSRSPGPSAARPRISSRHRDPVTHCLVAVQSPGPPGSRLFRRTAVGSIGGCQDLGRGFLQPGLEPFDLGEGLLVEDGHLVEEVLIAYGLGHLGEQNPVDVDRLGMRYSCRRSRSRSRPDSGRLPRSSYVLCRRAPMAAATVSGRCGCSCPRCSVRGHRPQGAGEARQTWRLRTECAEGKRSFGIALAVSLSVFCIRAIREMRKSRSKSADS